MPRFHCPLPLAPGDSIALPPNAARHAQVLRLQPGAAVTLFNGEGGEFDATVQQMGRSSVQVQVGAHHALEREATRAVHLVVGMPANERMDWLVEKATELGVASIQPVLAERSVLKLKGERADKKRAHWQGIAIAACEQCGRNRVPAVGDIQPLERWLGNLGPAAPGELRLMMAPGADRALTALPAPAHVILLIGAEGGLDPQEMAAAAAAGFVAVRLGPRVLRTETAGLAALAAMQVLWGDFKGDDNV